MIRRKMAPKLTFVKNGAQTDIRAPPRPAKTTGSPTPKPQIPQGFKLATSLATSTLLTSTVQAANHQLTTHQPPRNRDVVDLDRPVKWQLREARVDVDQPPHRRERLHHLGPDLRRIWRERLRIDQTAETRVYFGPSVVSRFEVFPRFEGYGVCNAGRMT